MLKTLELVSVKVTFKVVDAKLLLFTKIDSMTAKSKSVPDGAVNKVVALVVVKLKLSVSYSLYILTFTSRINHLRPLGLYIQSNFTNLKILCHIAFYFHLYLSSGKSSIGITIRVKEKATKICFCTQWCKTTGKT